MALTAANKKILEGISKAKASGQAAADSAARADAADESESARQAASKESKAAREFQSAEASTAREFQATQRREAFSQFTGFISPYMDKLTNVGGEGEGGGGGYTAQEQSGLDAVTSSIEKRGEQAQGRLSSALARRGIFRGGASAAAAATLEGETEAGVAQARGGFAESSAERRFRERQGRRQALSSAIGGASASFM